MPASDRPKLPANNSMPTDTGKSTPVAISGGIAPRRSTQRPMKGPESDDAVR